MEPLAGSCLLGQDLGCCDAESGDGAGNLGDAGGGAGGRNGAVTPASGGVRLLSVAPSTGSPPTPPAMSAGASGPTVPQGAGPWARSAAEAVALRAADRRPQSEARRQTNRRWTRRVRHQQRRRRFRCWWALLEQAAGAEGIVVAGAATPPHEPSETQFEVTPPSWRPPSRCGQPSWRPWSQGVRSAPTTVGRAR